MALPPLAGPVGGGGLFLSEKQSVVFSGRGWVLRSERYRIKVAGPHGVRARDWDEAVPAGDLSDAAIGGVDALPALRGDVWWRGSLLPVEGGWHLSGSFEIETRRECARCTRRFWWRLQVRVDRPFLTAELEDDPRVDATGMAHLIDLLREEVWLAWPRFVLCRAECSGGPVERRVGDDPNPFASLAGLKFE